MKNLNKTTWKQIVNDDIAERFDIEVGDSKQPDFKPQVKLLKWDNECNFSVRAIDNEVGDFKPKKVGNKIKLIKNKREYRFYEDGEHFEFEVILKEKPATNKIEMSIETKGLKFYYQPELTEEEKKTCHRPENVVGSYAVYHESKAGDYSQMGLKNYRAGKFGHFYYPYLIDANGWKVRAEDFKIELNEQRTNGALRIVAPQEFLDNAIYPVIVDPTFGYTTEGDSGENDLGWNAGAGSKFTLGRNAVITSMTVIRGAGGTSVDHATMAIYDSDLNFVVQTDVFLATATSDEPSYSSDVDSEALDGGIYWLLFIKEFTSGGNATSYHYDTGDTNQGVYAVNNPHDPVATLDPAYNDRKYSIYATYTANLPTITTQAVTDIEETTAVGNGNITADGGATATRGMCWDTATTPTITDSHATNGTGEGAYTVAMTSLVAGTKYYVRAYSINSAGTSYGSEVNFTTEDLTYSSPLPAFRRQ